MKKEASNIAEQPDDQIKSQKGRHSQVGKTQTRKGKSYTNRLIFC